jgi:hypothetical protein
MSMEDAMAGRTANLSDDALSPPTAKRGLARMREQLERLLAAIGEHLGAPSEPVPVPVPVRVRSR